MFNPLNQAILFFHQDAQVTIECDIPQQFHRTVMGARGSNVQDITANFKVAIKFPDRPMPNGNEGKLQESIKLNWVYWPTDTF